MATTAMRAAPWVAIALTRSGSAGNCQRMLIMGLPGLYRAREKHQNWRMAVDEPRTSARAFWIVAPGRGEIRSEALSPPGGRDVVVRTLYSGISRGTEAIVFKGRVPPSELERMRAP